MLAGYQLSMADELPIPDVPDIQFWSENYAFYGYDLEQRIGYVIYAGRWVKNPQIWREQLYIYLPDGTVLAHRAMGEAPDLQLPASIAMRFRCEAPGGPWRISFNGAMRHATRDEFANEPVKEGAPHPVSFEVMIGGEFPVLMMPSADNTNYGKYHFEQMGSCRGTVSFAGQTLDFSGSGYRDHSRGPRQLGNYSGHVWLQLYFPEQPHFSAYHMWTTENGVENQILDKTFSISRSGFGEAALYSTIKLDRIEELSEHIDISLMLEGRDYELRGKAQSVLFNSFTEDFDFYYGCVPSLAQFVSVEQPIMFEGSGLRVMGYLQRSTRIGRL